MTTDGVDYEAIKNLSIIATKLQNGNLTIPGNVSIEGKLTIEGKNVLTEGKPIQLNSYWGIFGTCGNSKCGLGTGKAP
jgi:phage baseplate assembly protein gpV